MDRQGNIDRRSAELSRKLTSPLLAVFSSQYIYLFGEGQVITLKANWCVNLSQNLSKGPFEMSHGGGEEGWENIPGESYQNAGRVRHNIAHCAIRAQRKRVVPAIDAIYIYIYIFHCSFLVPGFRRHASCPNMLPRNVT